MKDVTLTPIETLITPLKPSRMGKPDCKDNRMGMGRQQHHYMKQALIQHGPLIICIGVWEDFMWYFGGVYHHRWGPQVGGHVVTIVGYNDSQSCWIVKNSWGTKWGEDGWFRMAYDANMIEKWGPNSTGVMYIDGRLWKPQARCPESLLRNTGLLSHLFLWYRNPDTFEKTSPTKSSCTNTWTTYCRNQC